MARIVLALLALLVAVAFAKTAYHLPAGAELILRARTVIPGFICPGRPYGYYADTLNNCELFHICAPIFDDEGNPTSTGQFTFMCGNTTIFDQSTLTCNNEADSLPCSEAEDNYDVANKYFGVVDDTRK